MIKSSVTVHDVVSFLNELTALDPAAMHNLVERRVECNEAIADHPTVQVSSRVNGDGSDYEVGILGLLNGLFGTDDKGYGAIAAVYEEGMLVRFEVRKLVFRGEVS